MPFLYFDDIHHLICLGIHLICRRGLSLQTVSDTVVQEVRKLLLVHPMLVLATKAANLGDKYLKNEVKRLVASFFMELERI